jgi:hypothetical protein
MFFNIIFLSCVGVCESKSLKLTTMGKIFQLSLKLLSSLYAPNFHDDIFKEFLSFAYAKNFHYPHCLLTVLKELLNYSPFQYPKNYFHLYGHQTGFFGIKFIPLNNFLFFVIFLYHFFKFF